MILGFGICMYRVAARSSARGQVAAGTSCSLLPQTPPLSNAPTLTLGRATACGEHKGEP